MPHQIAQIRQNAANRQGQNQFDPLQDLDRVQDATRESVTAFGRQLQPEITRQIGSAFRGLNSIGALRSGATNVALGDINQMFADRVGLFASRATAGAIGQSLQAGSLRQDNRRQDFVEDEARRRRQGGFLRSLGNVIGAGIGFVANRYLPAGPGGGGGK